LEKILGGWKTRADKTLKREANDRGERAVGGGQPMPARMDGLNMRGLTILSNQNTLWAQGSRRYQSRTGAEKRDCNLKKCKKVSGAKNSLMYGSGTSKIQHWGRRGPHKTLQRYKSIKLIHEAG